LPGQPEQASVPTGKKDKIELRGLKVQNKEYFYYSAKFTRPAGAGLLAYW